jgi:hypothetical protein
MGFQDRLQALGRSSPVSARPEALDDNRRWARRKPRNTPATIMFAGITTPIACLVRDTSSTGAMIEMIRDRYNSEGSTGVVQDEFTLTITLDRTSVECRVMWRSAHRLGIRFLGPTVTHAPPRRPTVKVTPGFKR